jgi:hypothetical protein
MLGRSDSYDAAIPLESCTDIPTSMYVMATPVSTLRKGNCKDSLLAKTVSCCDGDLTSGHEMPQGYGARPLLRRNWAHHVGASLDTALRSSVAAIYLPCELFSELSSIKVDKPDLIH